MKIATTLLLLVLSTSVFAGGKKECPRCCPKWDPDPCCARICGIEEPTKK